MRSNVERSDRWCNPGAVLLQCLNEVRGFFGTVGQIGFVGDRFPRGGVSLSFCFDETLAELFFPGGKRESETAVEKMLDAAHTGVRSFGGADFEWQMAEVRD